MFDHRENRQSGHGFEDIISIENILAAWHDFVSGKRKKIDVQEFSYHLMDNIIGLHEDLKSDTYHHGPYEAFKISDPKPRDIHKATVRDRLMHHAIYRRLYPFFDRTWVADSYSCRNNKGTHLAMERFKRFYFKVSKNNTRTAWVLKCDIRKFFASIDHEILLKILSNKISDHRTIKLVRGIIDSFSSIGPGKGLPLGNLTSQMLVNVYMNEFDQYMKHGVKAKFYIRYADDFVILSEDRTVLVNMIPIIKEFLETRLKLSLHPHKVSIGTVAAGIDFLGWVHFPTHRILRTTTKRRMIKNLTTSRSLPRMQSYSGLLSHGNAHRISTKYGLIKS